jgi:hypothetical protein
MLKMKVEPTMCMKTLASGDNFTENSRAFWSNRTDFAGIGAKID